MDMQATQEDLTTNNQNKIQNNSLTSSYKLTLKRQIFNHNDLQAFINSQIYIDYIDFITKLSQSVKGISSQTNLSISPICQTIIEMLSEFGSWIPQITVHQHKSRFGNPAFNIWFDKLVENSEKWIEKFIAKEFIPEIRGYLHLSFGNPERIDYGTGHEAHFAIFL
eukprot:TRINITY_DN2436_c0_g3_i2.p1 TRINITY_DN2436_c0_g3~~TRINITY_DN2436_c0_g3_i2.p1  ORF type:complete len:191 (-),score=53.41 TRINITY_DN2436_c0_g3_i2:38-535(-)